MGRTIYSRAPVILCLGEAIVDLVCERELDSRRRCRRVPALLRRGARQRRRLGRPLGRRARLAGGVGDDPFGHWLAERLEAEGSPPTSSRSSPACGRRSPSSPSTASASPTSRSTTRGSRRPSARSRTRSRPRSAPPRRSPSARTPSSGERERVLTMRARELALDRGVPVLFDPNLRAHRWDDLEVARERCLEAAQGCFCLRMNAAEAEWLAPGAGERGGGRRGAGGVGLGDRGRRHPRRRRGGRARRRRGRRRPASTSRSSRRSAPATPSWAPSPPGFAKRGWEPGAVGEALPEANAAGAGSAPCGGPCRDRPAAREGHRPSRSRGGAGSIRRPASRSPGGAGRRLGPAAQSAGARDPRSPARALRAAAQRAARATPCTSSSSRSCPRTRTTGTATSPTGGCASAFDDWEEVRDAPTGEVADAIRPGGLADTKAPRIQAVLARARRADRPRLAARARRASRRSSTWSRSPASAARRRPA